MRLILIRSFDWYFVSCSSRKKSVEPLIVVVVEVGERDGVVVVALGGLEVLSKLLREVAARSSLSSGRACRRSRTGTFSRSRGRSGSSRRCRVG